MRVPLITSSTDHATLLDVQNKALPWRETTSAYGSWAGWTEAGVRGLTVQQFQGFSTGIRAQNPVLNGICWVFQ